LVDLGSELGIIEKSGAWFSYGGERIGQGRENAKAYLEQHPDAMDKIEAMILTKHGINRSSGGPQPNGATTNGVPADEKAPKRATMPKPAN
jgi:recombination protein RecA